MDFIKKYFKYENNLKISGLTNELNIFYMLYLLETYNKNVLVVTNSLYEANNINNSLSTYTKDNLLFPMDDFFSSMILASSPELKYTRLETLDKINQINKNIVVTNLMGLLKFLPNLKSSLTKEITLNMILKRDEIINILEDFGYEKTSLVTSTGEYAVRGFIIDVFLINNEHPVRIEFDGNIIESIRYFDEYSQITKKDLDRIIIKPINEKKDEINNSLVDYLNDPIVVFINKNQIDVSYEKLQLDIFNYQKENNLNEKMMFDINDINIKNRIFLETFEKNKDDLVFNSHEIINYNLDFEKLKKDYNLWIKNKKEVYFYLSNDNQKKIIKELIPSAKIVTKKINNGFIFYDYVVIGENDLEVVKTKPINYKKTYYMGKKIKDFNQLEIGDYVVHIAHGIGLYNGLKTLSVKGLKKDFLEISYLGNDKVYVPVEKITTIFKYSSKDGVEPKLNNLNSLNWEKTKKYVTKKVQDISQELIKLYQERIKTYKEPYRDFEEEILFDHSFDYELTKDQKKSINDIETDLKSKNPMDRLLCGDVGFGKTEVAMRAIFKTVLNNKQVMYLCPTTILAKQQYNVALKRFSNWPLEIELLNRHVSQSDAKKIIERLKNGKVDIIFGTHRLLSNDINFKDLGLLVVDEEQRFGVTHKEKIKTLKKDLNVLTLSATPIPRTLKMAMSGLRDLSIIDTPPVNRYPVQTYVIKEDDFIIKDAIYKELSRQGQIFILYNRIENIEDIVYKINQLVPEARVSYAHGRMDKNKLDKIMSEFIENKYDILICTTIIENGIDIPNVNTLIVFDADHFGLSQLYQIRGRVGRSNKIAYAYLLYKPNKMLNEIAVKRLNAIKDFTELGSGYKIAMRDLSIRGAGDIFGANQAGFVDAVGVSLYLKLTSLNSIIPKIFSL